MSSDRALGISLLSFTAAVIGIGLVILSHHPSKGEEAVAGIAILVGVVTLPFGLYSVLMGKKK